MDQALTATRKGGEGRRREVRSYERDGRMYLDGGSYHEVWTDAHIDNIDEEWMDVCIHPSRNVRTLMSMRKGSMLILKGWTFVFVSTRKVLMPVSSRKGQRAEACINEETTKAHINEELTDTHIDNIDEESHTYDKEGRYAHMKEIYISSIETRNLLFM